MVDAVLVEAVPAAEAPGVLAEAYAAAGGSGIPGLTPATASIWSSVPNESRYGVRTRIWRAHRHAQRGVGDLSRRPMVANHRADSRRAPRSNPILFHEMTLHQIPNTAL